MTPHPSDAGETLPALPDPTRGQLVVAGIAIVIAVILVGAVAARLVRHVELLQWWVPFAFVAGVAAADFASGLVHWSADTWGRADFPIIGPRLLVPFRVHHVNPDDFLRRRFLDTNGDLATLAIPALAILLVVPLDSAWQHALAIAGLAFCALSGMTNQIHQWAHRATPPAIVRALQSSGLLLRPTQHAIHHRGLYDTGYCITTGWCNRPLEAIRFFRRLEIVITRLSGLVPRADEHIMTERHPPGRRSVAHDV